MKPKNNRVMCPDSGKQKMLFESESKANNFIKWNGDDIDARGGVLRAYYCPSCCGWHISHKEHKRSYDTNTDKLIDAYKRSIYAKKVKSKAIDTLIDKKIINCFTSKETRNKIVDDVISGVNANMVKKDVKRLVNEYFEANGIVEDDGGMLRSLVYKKWKSIC